MVKVISLSDEAYVKLSKLKRDLSFSQVVIELIEGKKKKSLREIAGELSGEIGKEFKKDVLSDRGKLKMREVSF